MMIMLLKQIKNTGERGKSFVCLIIPIKNEYMGQKNLFLQLQWVLLIIIIVIGNLFGELTSAEGNSKYHPSQNQELINLS